MVVRKERKCRIDQTALACTSETIVERMYLIGVHT